MKKYLFELHFQNKDLTYNADYHFEFFENFDDVRKRAKNILKEGRRDLNAYLLSVYCKAHGDFKLVMSLE